MRHFLHLLSFISVLSLCLSASALQAQNKGLEGPAAAGLNPIFSIENKWTLYGAPQQARLSRAEFDALIADIRNTKFSSSLSQVVVILRDSQIEGTIGLIVKRGRRGVASLFVGEGGVGAYDVWHAVGYDYSPEKLLADCQENVLAAEITYKDLPLTFNAAVKKVAKDPSGEIFIEFSIKNKETTLICYPWENAPQRVDLRSLRTGDRLKVSGQFTKYSPEHIKMRSCLFSN